MMVKIADMYYRQKLTQQEISNIAHIHRTEISRMLKDARALGIVSITINTETESVTRLEKFFKKTFGLKNVILAPANPQEDNDLNALSIYASLFLSRTIKSGDKVGLGWGSTLFGVVSAASTETKKKDVTFVPMVGGPMGKINTNYHGNHLVQAFAQKYNGTSLMLDTPAFVSGEALRAELLKNPNVKEIIDLWRQLDIAIFGIGSASLVSTPEWQAFYKNTNFKAYFEGDMIGDILSYPYDANGIVANGIQQQLIALPYTRFQQIPTTVGIAFGDHKSAAILAALQGKWMNTLITTEKTADSIRKLYELKKSHL
ncbi:MAG: sugar-binding transcriptional regulator [Lactobacillus sp.]|nr:sugar-binding transcriptional regulator [Lactobacillus sp.]MCI2032322.1 sugar-binding transcriptional regulator [Lactobacillus sp.]